MAVIGVGIDVVDLERFAASLARTPGLGERLFTRQDVRPYLEAGCIDIIQPDVAHAGGISEVRKIANMAECVSLEIKSIHFACRVEVSFLV